MQDLKAFGAGKYSTFGHATQISGSANSYIGEIGEVTPELHKEHWMVQISPSIVDGGCTRFRYRCCDAILHMFDQRWAKVITHVPCNATDGRLLITATLHYIDGSGGILGFAGPVGVHESCPGISYGGEMTFDSADVSTMEERGYFEGVIMHEMGHVVGIG